MAYDHRAMNGGQFVQSVHGRGLQICQTELGSGRIQNQIGRHQATASSTCFAAFSPAENLTRTLLPLEPQYPLHVFKQKREDFDEGAFNPVRPPSGREEYWSVMEVPEQGIAVNALKSGIFHHHAVTDQAGVQNDLLSSDEHFASDKDPACDLGAAMANLILQCGPNQPLPFRCGQVL